MGRIVAGLIVTLLVLPTLAVTAARVLPGNSLLWVILRACAPMAILPYTIAAIVLIALSVGLHGAAQTVTQATFVVVTTLLFLHVCWFIKPSLSEAPGSTIDDHLIVMTANLHLGRADPEAVLDAVDRDDVDVLVLEEITPSALARLDRAGLDRRLDHRVGSPRPNRDGIMLFSTAPLRALTGIDTSSPGFSVEITTSGGPVRIFAVHPTAPNNGVSQWADDLHVIVAAARASRGATLLAGDFNATLDHPQLQALMDSDYSDASADAGLGWRPTWPSTDNVQLFGVGLPPLFTLDHVFVRGPLEATHAHVREALGTDHRALVTRIAWTDAGHRPSS